MRNISSIKTYPKGNVKNQGTNKPRVEWIDLAKGLCMLLVIWNHTRDPFRQLHLVPFEWFTQMGFYFRMPLYFFLSGLFFKTYDGFVAFLKKKTNKLLIPFTTFTLLSLLLQVEWFTPVWFLLSLFYCNVIFYFLHIIGKGRWWIIYPLAIAIGVLGYHLQSLPIWLRLGCALTSMPFFVAGHALRNYTSFLKSKANYIIDILIVGVCIYVLYKTCHIYHGWLAYSQNRYDDPIWAIYLGGFVGTAAVMLIARTVKWLPVISYIGRYSIIVLITHFFWVKMLTEPFMRGFTRTMYYVTKTSPFDTILVTKHSGLYALILTVIGIVLVSLPIIWFCRKYLPYIFAQKDVI